MRAAARGATKHSGKELRTRPVLVAVVVVVVVVVVIVVVVVVAVVVVLGGR